ALMATRSDSPNGVPNVPTGSGRMTAQSSSSVVFRPAVLCELRLGKYHLNAFPGSELPVTTALPSGNARMWFPARISLLCAAASVRLGLSDHICTVPCGMQVTSALWLVSTKRLG